MLEDTEYPKLNDQLQRWQQTHKRLVESVQLGPERVSPLRIAVLARDEDEDFVVSDLVADLGADLFDIFEDRVAVRCFPSSDAKALHYWLSPVHEVQRDAGNAKQRVRRTSRAASPQKGVL